MQKILKLTGVSMLAIAAATNANAAGYTCEELIEYTSCNPGFYLELAGSTCPDDYTFKESLCCFLPDDCDDDQRITQSQCEEEGRTFYARVCYSNTEPDDYDDYIVEPLVIATTTCKDCPAGYSCSGGDAAAVACVAGKYQPNTKQASCIDAPAGNYVAGTGATAYTACAAGSYQPTAGQASCITCPAGSYCAGTGLSAVSGECAVGTYSTGGATASSCTSCPASGLIDANGNVVSVTTESTGSTSSSACFVAKGTLFKDLTGIYRYTDKCNHGNYGSVGVTGIYTKVTSEEECAKITGAYWEGMWDACVLESSSPYLPQNEEYCNIAAEMAGAGSDWVSWNGEECICSMPGDPDNLGTWFLDSNGINCEYL